MILVTISTTVTKHERDRPPLQLTKIFSEEDSPGPISFTHPGKNFSSGIKLSISTANTESSTLIMLGPAKKGKKKEITTKIENKHYQKKRTQWRPVCTSEKFIRIKREMKRPSVFKTF